MRIKSSFIGLLHLFFTSVCIINVCTLLFTYAQYLIMIGDIMLRTIILFLFLVLFFIVGFPIHLILTAMDKKNSGIKTRVSEKLVKYGFKCCLAISGAKITVKGIENVPLDQPVLFVSNHRSYFDILVTYVSSPIPLGFVAKKEMEKIPGLATWMRNIRCLFLDRENIKEGLKTILQGVEQLKSGYSIFICPEGTRNQGDELLPFKEGSTKMAEKAKVPIVPIALTNTDALFERNSFFSIKPAHVTIEFGKPIVIEELEKDQKKFLGEYLQTTISNMLKNNVE